MTLDTDLPQLLQLYIILIVLDHLLLWTGPTFSQAFVNLAFSSKPAAHNTITYPQFCSFP